MSAHGGFAMNEPTRNRRRIRVRLWAETCLAITEGRPFSWLPTYNPQLGLFP